MIETATNVISKPILTMQAIKKSFGSLQVLHGVDFKLYAGQIMALMGENGAGKSTLIKILAAIEKADSGIINYLGKERHFVSPLDSEMAGIVVIHQELNLFDQMSVLDNLFLGSEILNKDNTTINYSMQKVLATEIFKSLHIDIAFDSLVSTLSIGEKQLLEIAKALRKEAKVLVMDEPTSALSDEEIAHIFKIINQLKDNGLAVVYISHRMSEIYQICDKVTVLRDGSYIGEYDLKELQSDKLVELMVGRTIDEPFPYLKTQLGAEVLRIENLANTYLSQISFSLNEGEILGVGGLMGSGRSSLAHMIYGLVKAKQGHIFIDGKEISIKHPEDALSHKIVYLSEDRKGDGLWLDFNIKYNISIASLYKFINKIDHIDGSKEESTSSEFMNLTKVKAANSDVVVRSLSGGNQQKVALARALLCDAKVLILDEPTRGIDIGARREIYNLINKFKDQGLAIILISSDMQELLSLSDRVLVMREMALAGILDFEQKSAENVMKLAVGIS